MTIIIPDDYQNAVKQLDCFKLLNGHEVIVYNDTVTSVDELAKRFEKADVLVLIRERTEISAELLSKLPNLKLISQTGKISNHLDLEACTKHNVAVAEGAGSPVAPAELTWALIMNAWRKLPQAIEEMKNGKWQTNIGCTLEGETLGIWGYGKIGKRIANYGKAFGMKILVWGSKESRNNAIKDGFNAAESKQTFFSGSDIVTLHLRLNKATTGVVSFADLSYMKSTSLIVNTSRAELIETGALLKALQNGNPGFAALDVYENEPVNDRNNPFLKMANVICTPHLGYVEQKGYELYFSNAFQNAIAFASGNPVNIANPEVLNV
jgi:D-3-phosphoglycerate dehydrogenase